MFGPSNKWNKSQIMGLDIEAHRLKRRSGRSIPVYVTAKLFPHHYWILKLPKALVRSNRVMDFCGRALAWFIGALWCVWFLISHGVFG